MTDLAAWLLEQTAVLEQDAELIHSLNCGGFMHNEQGLHEELCDCGEPARVLAECAARRALIAEIMSWQHDYVNGDCWFSCSQAIDPDFSEEGPGSGCCDDGRAGSPCDCGLDARRDRMLRTLAQPLSDRIAFDPS